MSRFVLGAGAALSACLAATACGGGEEELLFDLREVEEEFIEVVECRWSHEHELHHVRVVADPEAAEIYSACVLTGQAGDCEIDGEPVREFPAGSLFVKYEYDHPGCHEEDFLRYTATERLPTGSFEDGHDWHWQDVNADKEIVQDGAPVRCLDCHEDHCGEAPYGMDMRCLPD